MKNLILSAFALCSIGLFVGCSCDEKHTEYNSAATMSDDSKDMQTPHHHHHTDTQ